VEAAREAADLRKPHRGKPSELPRRFHLCTQVWNADGNNKKPLAETVWADGGEDSRDAAACRFVATLRQLVAEVSEGRHYPDLGFSLLTMKTPKPRRDRKEKGEDNNHVMLLAVFTGTGKLLGVLSHDQGWRKSFEAMSMMLSLDNDEAQA